MKYTLLLLSLCTMCIASFLGMDFGHDFTKSVVIAPNLPLEIVLTADSKRKDVSGLHIKPLKGETERSYGSNAASTRFPENSLLHLKELLGHGKESIAAYSAAHPGVKLETTSRNTLCALVGDHCYPVEELVAMNFEETLVRAGQLLTENSNPATVRDIAITVPEFYTQSQRMALIDAASLANLKVTALVSDGMAVAIDWAIKRAAEGSTEYHIIYDSGAASTTATLVKISNIDTLSVELVGYGYYPVGGAALTQSVAQHIKNQFVEKHNVAIEDLEASPRALAKINQAAEKAKLVLSANTEAYVSIEGLYDEIDFRGIITRAEFEESNKELDFGSLVLDALNTLNGEDVKVSDVSSVILAGGSSRVPFVQRDLIAVVGEEKLSRNVNADEAAVMGVTLRGVAISGVFQVKPIDVIDRSIFQYDIIVDGETLNIFEKGSQYGNMTVVSVEAASNISLLENGEIYVTHTVGKTKSPLDLHFTLTESRVFELAKVTSENVTIATTKKHAHTKPLSASDKLELKTHMQKLTNKERSRARIHEELNILEAGLYRAREFLEDETLHEVYPRYEEMVADVDAMMDWLEYDSAGCKLKDVESKTAALQSWVKEAKQYTAMSGESLDEEVFEEFVESLSLKVAAISEAMTNYSERLQEVEGSFRELKLSLKGELKKIRQPRHIQRTEEQIKATLESCNSTIDAIEQVLDGDFDSVPRQELFELKLSSKAMSELLSEDLKSIIGIWEHRLRELQAAVSRKIRQLKRKADREAAKAAEAAAAENENAESVADAEETANNAEEILNTGEPVDTTEEIVHDEL